MSDTSIKQYVLQRVDHKGEWKIEDYGTYSTKAMASKVLKIVKAQYPTWCWRIALVESEANRYEGHTPGSWPLDHVHGAIRHIVRNVDHDTYCFDAHEGKCEFSWSYKDATLIADAPKLLAERNALLEAARNILCPGGGVYASPQLEGALRAAIALVEGAK